MGQAIISGAAVGGLYVLMSIGFAMSLEIADIVNAGYGAVVVGGMYITLELFQHHVNIWLAIVIAGVVTGVLSWPFYSLFMRSARLTAGHKIQLVYTLLLFSALTALYQLLFGATFESITMAFPVVHFGGYYLGEEQVIGIVLALLIPIGLFLASRHTLVGKLAYSASRYPLGARSLGAPVDLIYLIVFVIAGFLAGIAGGMLMTFQSVQPALGLEYTITVFLVALVARTNLLACLALGLVYGIVQSIFSYLLSGTEAVTLTLSIFIVALMGERMLQGARTVYRGLVGR